MNISDCQLEDLQQRKTYLKSLRDQMSAQQLASSGIEACEWLSDRLDELLLGMLHQSLQTNGLSENEAFSVMCVGGNGRRRPAPYSDVDMLLVADKSVFDQVEATFSDFVRDCWDTGFQLGHSLRTPEDVISFAKDDIQFATSLVDMRLLVGSNVIFHDLRRKLKRTVFRQPVDRFVEECVESRQAEWSARGDSVNQLEPDVKKSPGGLRDLHLIHWITFARFADGDPSSLLEHNEVRTHELAILNQADEFLTALRNDLHLRAGLKQDVLTRDLQLEMVRSNGETDVDFRKPIEDFMQEYFQQTSKVSEITRRVSEANQKENLLTRISKAVIPFRRTRNFTFRDGLVQANANFLKALKRSPTLILQPFVKASKQNLEVCADLKNIINKTVDDLPKEPTVKNCSEMRCILRNGESLPTIIRSLYETGVLEWLIPPMAEIRCLMQFNQYHSYTVDEHTLKAVDEMVALEHEDSEVGTAYRNVRHKATLHLSIIMHDIAKGRDGDHSIVGEQVAEEIGERLQMTMNKRQMMMSLVRHHLVMPDLAFRRDITDQALLHDFARLVGAPELLRMLYVLSVADIRAVGPDVWTDWKGELLADLYNRTMVVLSGRPTRHLEEERLKLIRNHVRSTLLPPSLAEPVPPGAPVSPQPTTDPAVAEWIESQLDALPAFYLMMESPDRIAQDMQAIRNLPESGVLVEGEYAEETDTMTYRIFVAQRHEQGSFHKVAGVLSGLRMDILSAETCGSPDGTLIGAFRVCDNDFVGNVSEFRIKEVSEAIEKVLVGKATVDTVFRRSGLFRPQKNSTEVREAIRNSEPHISIDNDGAELHTVIDVFAINSPGLLYTLSKTLFDHDISIELTRIATNIDQVVDVFYVNTKDGKKLKDLDRLQKLKDDLMAELVQLKESQSD